ncbi:MAG TPA: HAD-IIIA family hydrolase [Bacteroidales bacterium]|nr:HAD-IIIA family hydrolase [Bacteroidales bacterium]
MKAVILAGGKGTRLGEFTREIPKPMIPIGNKPLLHHQVDLLVQNGITDIIILVNYLKDPIMSYFSDGSSFGARITYYEEKEPLGTTGGIREIEHLLTEDYLVLYGDVMVNMDITRLINFHSQRKSECTLVLHPNDHPFDSDLVETDPTDRVIAFHPKPHNKGEWYHNLVNAGVYVFSPAIHSYIEKGKKADFGKDIFPSAFGNLAMFGYHTTEYLKDMGTPDRLQKVNKDLESGKIERSSYRHLQPAVFLDRDGVINTERSYISKPEELEIYDFTAPAIRKINQAGYVSVVVTNQSAIARNLCTEEDVHTIHKKLETVLGDQGAWLDAIYYCPHHPDKGFPEENPVYKIECDCRKPATGMFKKAIEKFSIDPTISYMIGDSERDIQAGFNAGCITIGVRTGYGIRKTKLIPDYMFNDLKEAADFITDDPLDQTAVEILQKLVPVKKQRKLILVGGNTRSGKSTLASYLRLLFKRKGYKSLQVSLDNWLLAEENRTPGMNVYDRFQLKKIESDIRNLLSGNSVLLSTYTNHVERKHLEVIYNASDSDFIIIEGVVALSSSVLRDAADLKIFINIPTDLFLKRMEHYYSWRGLSGQETTALIKKREVDEYQLIEKESKLADLIINSPGT